MSAFRIACFAYCTVWLHPTHCCVDFFHDTNSSLHPHCSGQKVLCAVKKLCTPCGQTLSGISIIMCIVSFLFVCLGTDFVTFVIILLYFLSCYLSWLFIFLYFFLYCSFYFVAYICSMTVHDVGRSCLMTRMRLSVKGGGFFPRRRIFLNETSDTKKISCILS